MRTILILATAVACTGSSAYWVAYQPVRGTTTAERATAVQKATIAVTDAGKEIETSDAATGIVLTKWFSGDSFGGGNTRFRVRVTFDDQKGYEIVSLCQSKDPMSGAWGEEGCEKAKRPRFVLDTMARIEAGL